MLPEGEVAMSSELNARVEPRKDTSTITGILLLAAAFLPWVAYWILTRPGQPAGIAVALGIACLLLAQQLWTHS